MTNLNGSYFGNDTFEKFSAVDLNHAGVMNHTSKAVIWVFKPFYNQFTDVAMRPFIYSFDENFIGNAQEISDLAKRGTAKASSIMSDLMSTSNLSDNFLPSISSPVTFKASHLSDKWRFILVMTESGAGLSGGNTLISTNPSSQVRRIYNGYFTDEPYNPLTAMGYKKTLNPHAYMVITHKSVVGVGVIHGALGAQMRLSNESSEEIVHPEILKNLTVHSSGRQDRVMLMTPQNLSGSLSIDEDGSSVAVPGAHVDITNDNAASVVPDILEQPRHNVAHVVRGIVLLQDELAHRHHLTPNRNTSWMDEGHVDESMVRNKLTKHMGLNLSRRSNVFDLDVNDSISAQDLNDRVNGDLDVFDVEDERPQYYETADQHEMSVTNQYSFLIASVISPILNSAGLNMMSFEYSVARVNGLVQDDFTTHAAEPNWPIPPFEVVGKTRAVQTELIQGIFSTIFGSKGDFHVAVQANVTGYTKVQLSLIGQGYKNNIPYEFPSCMGGLVTPIVGDSNSAVTNSAAIESLYNVATGTGGHRHHFNADDREFADYANSLDFDGPMSID